MREYTFASLKLQTEAAAFLLELAEPSDGWVDANIRILPETPFADFQFREVQSWMNRDDLGTLRDSIRQHIRNIREGPKGDVLDVIREIIRDDRKGGAKFRKLCLPLNMGFMITLLAGEASAEGDGCFTATILVNAGLAGEDKSNGYFGFEAVVDFADAESFCAEIDAVLSRMGE